MMNIKIRKADASVNYKPILIKKSFKKPLFNEEMKTELLSAKEWLLSAKLPEGVIKFITRMIKEIIFINDSLLMGHSFEELTDKYHCYREYKNINPKIKYSAICNVCDNAVFSKKNKEKLMACIRHLSIYICTDNLSDNDYNMYCFLHRFCISFLCNFSFSCK